MSRVRIPRGASPAVTLGGRLEPIKPYAVRIDVPYYQAVQLINDSRKDGATYELRKLGEHLEKALAPYRVKP